MGIRFRRPDTPRVLKAAQIVGVTPSELVRLATLEKIERLGVTRAAILQDTDKASILAATTPQKALQAQTKMRENVQAFREQPVSNHPNPSQSVTRETFTDAYSSEGMKDKLPRL